jgi:hypothetical protein
MVRNSLWTMLVGGLLMFGCLAPANAAPMAPSAITARVSAGINLVSFWGLPFPFGYAYRPGQCYKEMPVDTGKGVVWKRVWICTEPGGRDYGEGGRF